MSEASYQINKEIETVFTHLKRSSRCENGATIFGRDQAQTLQEQIELAEIGAPPFEETKRALAYKSKLQELGLEDVKQDQKEMYMES